MIGSTVILSNMPKIDTKKPKQMLSEAKRLKALAYTPFPKEERVLRLERLYDEALLWLEEAVAERIPKGTGAATLVLERTRLEIEEVQRAGQGSRPQKIELIFKPAPKEVDNPE